MAQISTDLLPVLRQSLEIDLPENISFELLKERLSSHINFLIQSDFQKLASILYRVDVSESKLKNLLKENQGFDAASIITDLIIARELQKIRSRQEYRNDENISEDEKWWTTNGSQITRMFTDKNFCVNLWNLWEDLKEE